MERSSQEDLEDNHDNDIDDKDDVEDVPNQHHRVELLPPVNRIVQEVACSLPSLHVIDQPYSNSSTISHDNVLDAASALPGDLHNLGAIDQDPQPGTSNTFQES